MKKKVHFFTVFTQWIQRTNFSVASNRYLNVHLENIRDKTHLDCTLNPFIFTRSEDVVFRARAKARAKRKLFRKINTF